MNHRDGRRDVVANANTTPRFDLFFFLPLSRVEKFPEHEEASLFRFGEKNNSKIFQIIVQHAFPPAIEPDDARLNEEPFSPSHTDAA